MNVQFRNLVFGDVFKLGNEVYIKTNFGRGYHVKNGRKEFLFVKKAKMVEPIKTLYGYESK